MPNNDAFTLALLTNDEVLAVNQSSTGNRQVFSRNNQIAWVADVPDSKDKYVALFNASPAPVGGGRGRGRRQAGASASSGSSIDASGANIALAAEGGTGAGGVAVASANPSAAPATAAPVLQSTEPAAITVTLADLGLIGRVRVRDLWTHKDLGIVADAISATVNSHGAVLYRVSPTE